MTFLDFVHRWSIFNIQSALKLFFEFVEKRINAEEEIQKDATTDQAEYYFGGCEEKNVQEAKKRCDCQ